ncbi:hypothetical protein [Aliiroseovarius sp. PrR006]|uniref:hypothetical protein n=1 Tax=Aliiroseovarius sp. PrR006 TaxID=2706883 RepID=UPI0013D75795|nr:hypothetical protein [Aliiroseovarius sp. PrR006]NDW52799.1 hypothetical protein [Aliiroseovarius sp. PrR006]
MRPAKGFVPHLVLYCFVLLFGIVPIKSFGSDEVSGSGKLDGMIFSGKISQSGQSGFDDKLSFSDGRFWSEICVRCGFKPGKYWTRSVDGGTHFIGEMHGDYGTFKYEGLIVQGEANVSVIWQKSRWYWTSSRALSFEGRLAPDMSPPSALQVEQFAIEALKRELPEHCW